MKTLAVIEMGEKKRFWIFTPDLGTILIGSGKTIPEAKDNFILSYNTLLQAYNETGKKLSNKFIDLEFEYKYDVASIFNELDYIDIPRFSEKVGINPSLLRQSKSGTYITEEEGQKIEKELHKLGEKLLALSL